MAITTTNATATTKTAIGRTHSTNTNGNNNMTPPTNSNIDFTMNTSNRTNNINNNSNLIDSDTNNNNNNKNNIENIENDIGNQDNNIANKDFDNNNINTNGNSTSCENAHSPVATSTSTSISNTKSSNMTTTTASGNHVTPSRHKLPLNNNSYYNMNNNHRETNHYNNHPYYNSNNHHHNNNHHHLNHHHSHQSHHHPKHNYNNNIPKHKITPLTWSSYNSTNINNNNTIVNSKDPSQATHQASNASTTQPNNHLGQPMGPPYFVELHVNAGQCVSLQLLDGREQIVAGPATITMVSQQQAPPVPIPVQVPPGHMIHQIADENGTLKHIILSVMTNGDDSSSLDNSAFITLPQGSFRIDSHGELVCVNPSPPIAQDPNSLAGPSLLSQQQQQAYYANYDGCPFGYVPTSSMMVVGTTQFESSTITPNPNNLAQPGPHLSLDSSRQQQQQPPPPQQQQAGTAIYYNQNQSQTHQNHHSHNHHGHGQNHHNHNQHSHQNNNNHNYLQSHGLPAYSSVVSSGARHQHHQSQHYNNNAVNTSNPPINSLPLAQTLNSTTQIQSSTTADIKGSHGPTKTSQANCFTSVKGEHSPAFNDFSGSQKGKLSDIVVDKSNQQISKATVSNNKVEHQVGRKGSSDLSGGRHPMTPQSRDSAHNKQQQYNNQYQTQKQLSKDKNFNKNSPTTMTPSSPKSQSSVSHNSNTNLRSSGSSSDKSNRSGSNNGRKRIADNLPLDYPNSSVIGMKSHSPQRRDGHQGSKFYREPTNPSSPSPSIETNSESSKELPSASYQQHQVELDKQRSSPKVINTKNSNQHTKQREMPEISSMKHPSQATSLSSKDQRLTPAVIQDNRTKTCESNESSSIESIEYDNVPNISKVNEITLVVSSPEIKPLGGHSKSEVISETSVSPSNSISSELASNEPIVKSSCMSDGTIIDDERLLSKNSEKKDLNTTTSCASRCSPINGKNVGKSSGSSSDKSSRSGSNSSRKKVVGTVDECVEKSDTNNSKSQSPQRKDSNQSDKLIGVKTTHLSSSLASPETNLESTGRNQPQASQVDQARSSPKRTSNKSSNQAAKTREKSEVASVRGRSKDQKARAVNLESKSKKSESNKDSRVEHSNNNNNHVPNNVKDDDSSLVATTSSTNNPSDRRSTPITLISSSSSTSSRLASSDSSGSSSSGVMSTKSRIDNNQHNNNNNQHHHTHHKQNQHQQQNISSSHNTIQNSHNHHLQHNQPHQHNNNNNHHHHHQSSGNCYSGSSSASSHTSSLVSAPASTSSGHSHYRHGPGSHSKGGDASFKIMSHLRQFRTRSMTMFGKLFHDSLSNYSDTKFAGFIIMLFSSLSLLLALVIHMCIMRP